MENSNTNLGSESVGKLLFKLATPAIIAQIVNVLYNIVDRIFIGRMENGEVAMAGVGVAFPIIIIITACSYLIGMGGGPLAAIKMGEQNNDEAEKIMSNSFSVLVILAILLTIGFKIGKEPLLWMFGASESTIRYSMDYLNIYLIGTVFVQISMGMNTFINTQGFATTGMMTVAIGALINIILDPIFIFGFNMGVKGAALATIIAQGVSAIWVLMFLFGKKSILKIKKKYMIPKASIILPVLGLGISPFIMQSTESLVLIALNSKLQMYGGDLAVGSMAIMSSIMQILMLPNMGVTQGAQPIISYNYGSGQLDRVKKTFKLCLLSCFTYSTILWLLLMIFPAFFVSIFNKNPQLLSMTSWSIKIYFAGAFMFGIQIACQQTFLALGKATISLVLALLRKIVLLIPLIFILPTFFNEKLFAVILAEPVADITAATITAISFFIFYKCFLSKPKAIKE
ncbi:drug/sodium antiporter, MATE family [Clostridioides difficile]|uniref:Multidrug export protein MepA n=4 Tax=Clostridioides difficile TaxID=1496 RepID=A0A9R0BIW4_CLODR|nr:MATE family efflux transporter [Clostridioides difficile]OFT99897.1 MATE family efflux transporter [Clostridium sp. HMSC19E03]OFU20053.1 MATE family efflux transporter [Clostridium sp. HMSC19C09]OFU21650.1 MATE family efflux transporter [Clostridium sp. HMSC19C05]OFU22053.1 MATE family efflux transporter [Clostridium sp. HMSC19C08]OFU28966.1 MATE family efflux transporter [Clostridium sp. HMSC19B11]OFU34823.1 MATE family efflux transporter [Clostridium sp. HMSC19B10]OFU45800.1 MATE family